MTGPDPAQHGVCHRLVGIEGERLFRGAAGMLHALIGPRKSAAALGQVGARQFRPGSCVVRIQSECPLQVFNRHRQTLLRATVREVACFQHQVVRLGAARLRARWERASGEHDLEDSRNLGGDLVLHAHEVAGETVVGLRPFV